MVKDTLNSFFDNLKERTTNPFLGTFVVVWLIHNSELVYTLFYFDSGITLEGRLAAISAYFECRPFIIHLFISVVITIGVLLFTYVMLGITRYMTEFYEKIVLPKIAEKTKGGTVLRADFDAIGLVVTELETKLEKERLARISAQNERDIAEQRMLELISSRETVPLKVTPISQGNLEFKRIGEKLYNKWGAATTNNILSNIVSESIMNKSNETVRILAREGIIEPTGVTTSAGIAYRLSVEGKEFLKYWNNIFADREDNIQS